MVRHVYSGLKPLHYILLFSCFDVVALAIQAVGGAEAAKAQIQGSSTTTATHLMVPPPLAPLSLSILISGNRDRDPRRREYHLYSSCAEFVLPNQAELSETTYVVSVPVDEGVQAVCIRDCGV